MLSWFPLYNVNQLCVCIHSLLHEPPSHPTPPGHQSSDLSCLLNRNFLLAVCFTHDSMCVSMLLSIHPTLSFPHCVHKSILYIYVYVPLAVFLTKEFKRPHPLGV